MRRERNLERILAAGILVLARRGLCGMTMREVARESGVSLANLYSYVGGKEELAARAQTQVLEGALASAEAAAAARGARERLRALVTDHVRRVLARPFEARLLSSPLERVPDPVGRRLATLRNQYLEAVRQIVDQAVGAASSRAASERRAWMLLGMAERLAAESLGSSPRADRLAADVLALFQEGAG